MWFKTALLFGFVIGVLAIQYYDVYIVLYGAIVAFAVYSIMENRVKNFLGRNFLLFNDIAVPSRVQHDAKRSLTYPDIITNTWYHFCDSSEIVGDKVLEVRALGQTFIVWRAKDGKIVVQDAYCLHLGANIGVGGKVEDGGVVCPFHKWKFGPDGSVLEIPYINDPKKCPTHKKLKTYHAVEWCGLVCVFYHADDEEPFYDLPKFIPEEMARDDWMPHLTWDIGFLPLSPIDWVDQAGDHAHFGTLHADFLFPWTTIPIPPWLFKLVPVNIKHKLHTYIGDEKEWVEKVETSGWGDTDKHYIFFTDYVGLTWNGELMPNTVSETVEMFIGPAMMCFHIPFTIGTIKVFVTTTPCEGGSIMKVRTWVDGRVKHCWWKQYVAYILSGVSASQLAADITIMCNKIRLKKPILQPFDGPYNRTNGWLNRFYSKSSTAVSQSAACSGYKNDW